MYYSLRTPQTERTYREHLERGIEYCIYCEKDLLKKEYNHWVLLENRYPYDAIFSKHDMLAPKRHIPDASELSRTEWEDYYVIEEDLRRDYDVKWENFPHRRTIQSHYHIHLLSF